MNPTRRTMMAGVAWAAWTAAGGARAQTSETLAQLVVRTREARLAGDAATWREGALGTLALAPEHPDLLISAARASASLGHADEALRLLGDAAQRGAGFDPARFPEMAALDFSAGAGLTVAERATANLAPIARGTRHVDLPGPQCEGVAYDPRTRRLFSGSSDGRVFAVAENGEVSTFTEGLQQVLGMKVDARRRRLWLVSSRFPNLFAAAQQADVGYGGVRAYDVDSATLVGSWDLDERPLVHGFNDIALARNGEAYVTDSATGSVYRASHRSGALELFYRSDNLTILNGLALARDQRRLFLAHVEGVSVLDLRNRQARRLAVPASAAVNSIDGLAWLGRDLIGVQSSPYLARLVRIRLDRQGEAVASVGVLNARAPAEYSYTTCAVGGDAVYLVGGTPAPDPYGGPPLAPSPSPHLLRVDL
jgi:hypothetical protein